MENIILSNEVKKVITKNEYYSEDNFIKDAQNWIKAIKEGRIICSVVSVSSSGMTRQLKFLSCESSNYKDDEKYYFRQYNTMLQSLGFRYNKNKYCISVSGCGMDMIFHTNYTIIHQLKRMGFINDVECSTLSQMTPTNM